MKTIVITGCAGLLGSHFSRHLLDRGYKVIGIDDLSGGYSEYLPDSDHFEFWPIDLSEKSSAIVLEHIFLDPRREIVACYHFAAYAAEGLSPFIRYFNYKNNVLASANIINACINYNVKLIFTSSMAIYGEQTPPFTEKMNPKPIDPYGIAKYSIEQDIKAANNQHGLKYTIIRPHNVIGIYQNIWDKYRNVAGIFIRRVLDKQPMLIYGDGFQTRAFSDIQFYMNPFEKLIDSFDGYTFNIGADKTYTINELADTVEKIAIKYNIKAHREYAEARHEVKYAYCDHSLAKDPKNLNFNDQTNLEELIDKMFGWAITQPKRKLKMMPYEITKGIYEYWK